MIKTYRYANKTETKLVFIGEYKIQFFLISTIKSKFNEKFRFQYGFG